LGGVSFSGNTGATSTVRFSGEQDRVEIEYLQQPGGGTFTIQADDRELGQVATGGSDKTPGFASFDLPAGTRQIELRVVSGPVRLFGYSFERGQPGVIYSSLGLNGAQVQAVDRYFEPHQWTLQLQHQHPDLLIFNYGTNESVYPAYIEKQYPGELRHVVQKLKNALPGTPILIMSPMDRGERDSSGEIVTPAVLPKIVEIQKQTALDMGCAFFDTYDAMGGAGTMGKWYTSQPRLVSADFMHPLPGGAAKVGALLANAITGGYSDYEGQQRPVAERREPEGDRTRENRR
jgi:lysophospholipase L1-like esterase